MEETVVGAGEMQQVAARFIAALAPTAGKATIVTLSGDLGAGKTTFAQGVAKALGITEQVVSPTFVLENIYELEGQRWERLVHIDAYRLEGATELSPLGWDGLIVDAGNLIMLEWPEQVAGAIPSYVCRIRLEDAGEHARRIVVTYGS